MNSVRRNILIRGFEVGFGLPALLRDIDLQLHAGEITCLMGPNGSGKSTLLRTIAGLMPPVSGDLPGMNKAKLAVVLTDRIGNQALRAGEIVSMGRFPHLGWLGRLSDQDRNIVRDTMIETGILKLADLPVSALSDGQKQLVMLARAFAQQPDLLLLDEPTSHLDLNHRVEVMSLLRKWLSGNPDRMVLLSTHELDLALQFADRLWLVQGNRVVSGIPEDLVLGGTLDQVFQFKGFALKTGKRDLPVAKRTVRVVGMADTPSFAILWTRNALERYGFGFSDQAGMTVTVQQKGASLEWSVDGRTADSINGLLGMFPEQG